MHMNNKPIGAILKDGMCLIQQKYKHPGEMLGLSSGLRDLDNATGGFVPGDLIVIAARPAMRKSTLALQIVQHIAKRKPTLYISLDYTRFI